MPQRDYDSDIDDMLRRRRRTLPKRSDTNLIVVLAVVGGCILLVLGAAVGGYLLLRGKPITGPVEGPALIANDMDQLQGEQESIVRDPTSRVTMRKVKVITGNSKTATWYQPDSTIFRVNRVAFQPALRGQSKVFRYFDG